MEVVIVKNQNQDILAVLMKNGMKGFNQELLRIFLQHTTREKLREQIVLYYGNGGYLKWFDGKEKDSFYIDEMLFSCQSGLCSNRLVIR